jgi:excisionase family DNA binding protein
MEKLLSKKDVLEMLGIKESTLYIWVHRKKIPFIKLGRRTLRFRESDILEWIAEKAVRPQTAESSQSTRIKRPRSIPPKTNDDVQRLVNNTKRDILKK